MTVIELRGVYIYPSIHSLIQLLLLSLTLQVLCRVFWGAKQYLLFTQDRNSKVLSVPSGAADVQD